MKKIRLFLISKLSKPIYEEFRRRLDGLFIGFAIGIALSCFMFGAAVFGACWWLGVDGIMYDLAAKDVIVQNTLLNPEPAIRQHLEGLELLVNSFKQGALKAACLGLFMGFCGAAFPNLWVK